MLERGRGRAQLEQPIRVHGLTLALDRDLTQRIQRRDVVDQPAGEVADDDLVRTCGCLELRSDPDRLARHEPLARVGRSRHDLAGLDADPDLQRDVVLLRELLVERGDPDADVEGGSRGTQRIVLVGDGDAEGRHDSVARVLLHRPAVSYECGRHRLEVPLQDASERLGIERLRKRHRLDDVDEEDRDEPAELHGRLGERSLLEEERLVLAEDRGLELAELGTGVDAELLDERLPRGSVGGERVGLTARAVERQHQLRPRPLSECLRLDECLELSDELGVPAESEIGLDPLLERDRAQLLQPGDLGLGERLVEEVRERRPAPERERLAENALGRSGVTSLARRPPLLREAGEAMNVHALGGELELVARRASREDGPERLAELRDVDLDRVRRRFGRLAGPERLDQAVDGDDAAGVEGEHGEQRSRLRAAEGHVRPLPLRLDGAEESYLELWGACPARSVHAVIPSILCAIALSHASKRISIPL